MSAHKNPTTWPGRDNFIKAVLASELRDKAARVLVRMAMYLDPDKGIINPNYRTLANESGVKERSVYRILEQVEAEGWIEIVRSNGRISNQYILINTATQMAALNTATQMAALESPTLPNLDANTAKSSAQHCHTLADKEQEKSKKKSKGRKTLSRASRSMSETAPDFASRDSSKQDSADEGRDLFPTTQTTTKAKGRDDYGTLPCRAAKSAGGCPPSDFRGNSPKAPCTANGAANTLPHGGAKIGPDLGQSFDRFWALYPRRVAKEAARKAFAKAIEGVGNPDALIAGAQRYAVERAGQDPKYTKHPATWLNAGCWEDEAPMAAGGPPIIDGVTGEEIEQAPPRRKDAPKTWAEVADELLRELDEQEQSAAQRELNEQVEAYEMEVRRGQLH